MGTLLFDEEALDFLSEEQVAKSCPGWPGLRPERRSPTLAAELDRASRKACVEFRRLEREIEARTSRLLTGSKCLYLCFRGARLSGLLRDEDRGQRRSGKPMMARFCDNARCAVSVAFRHERAVPERELIAALSGQKGVAQFLLAELAVSCDALPAGASLDRRDVVTIAVAESQRCRASYVGTEHILLAVARRQESILRSSGVTADRLDELLVAAETAWRRAHPPFARRLGSALRAVGQHFRSRA